MTESLITADVIQQVWELSRMGEILQEMKGYPFRLRRKRTICLKPALGHPYYKNDVWLLYAQACHDPNILLRVILKILRKQPGGIPEVNMYQRGKALFTHAMPKLYATYEENDQYTWLFIEYVPVFGDNNVPNFEYLERVMPSLARLHAVTFQSRIEPYGPIFDDWLLRYDSERMNRRRERWFEFTKQYVERGALDVRTAGLFQSASPLLHQLLLQGPSYFPEVNHHLCVIHDDLQFANMGTFSRLSSKDWEIVFFDWELPMYGPCWYDLFGMIGVHLGYWEVPYHVEEEVTKRCVYLYTKEISKYGIVFEEDSFQLYKKAYLKRVLEYVLYTHTSRAIDYNKPKTLLPVFIDKLLRWGPELIK